MRVLSAATGLDEALEMLRSGGCVVHATETCYGLACDLGNPDAVKHLFAVKRRPEGQPVSALFPDLETAERYVVFSPKARELVSKHLPGPLTLVLPVQCKTPSPVFVTADGTLPATIGVRISSHPTARKLAERFDRPIATTSANIHGKENPYSIADIVTQWGSLAPVPDMQLDEGFLQIAAPSTVVEIVGERIRILRQGALRI